MSQRKIKRFWKNISLCYQFTYISITSYPDAIIPIMYQRIPNHLFWLFATPHLVYVLFRHHLAECKHFWHSTMWGQRQLCVSFVHVSLSFATACFQEDELFEPLFQCMDDTDATGAPLTSQQWQPHRNNGSHKLTCRCAYPYSPKSLNFTSLHLQLVRAYIS